MRYFILLAGMVLVLATAALGETYVVNPEGTGDFPTIQAAIDSVLDGDIIELTDGTFTGDGNRDISYLGKAITVRSQSGNPEACALDCENGGRGFYFQSGEGPGSVLTGVAVMNGYAQGIYPMDCGGAVYCWESSPTITDCMFLANLGSDGGGLYCRQASSPTLTGCTFAANSANVGGGMYCYDITSLTLSDCIFVGNAASDGGGLHFRSSSPTIDHCTFLGNSAWAGGGVGCLPWSNPTLRNCTFYGNTSTANHGAGIYSGVDSHVALENCVVSSGQGGAAIECGVTSSATLACCDVHGNEGGDWVGCIADQYGIDGNICEDPLFCDPGNGDFTLHCTSPCAPFTPPNPECDLIGAWPVGCGGTPVTSTTWGGIKALFRR